MTRLPLFLFLFLLPSHLGAQDQNDPEVERKSFTVAEGYEVTLWASEKEGVVKPLQIRWDAQGRLWVACGQSYPQLKPGEVADDTILVLEDPAGSGRATQSRVFARGLNMPMGLELGKGGAYVGHNGEIVHLRDDGGKAGAKTTLFKGFFAGDSHQNINSFVWGPGGELMICQGLHVFAHVETPWGVEKLDKAGVWRMRESRMRLDPFLGDDMGPQNPYGVVFDDYGQPLMVAGNGQGVYYLLPALVRTRHFQQFQQIWTKTNKLAGADIIGTAAMPDDVQGVMVCGGFLNNAVYWFQILEDGAGFRVKDLPALIVSSHPGFRAVDVRMGPDGAIYVADWYNPIIGHYQASFRHPDRDKAHGRIWRISAKGRPPVKAPALTTMGVPELLEQLRSTERWPRYQARRLLADRKAEEVIPATAAWAKALDPKDPATSRLLIEAIGLHESHEAVDAALLQRLLASADPKVRAYATRVIGTWHEKLPDAPALLAISAADEHPRVRLEAVVAASQIPHVRAVQAAAIVADRPMDRFINHALIQTVHALKPEWKPVFDAGELNFGDRPERFQALLKADGSKDAATQLVALLRSGKLSKEGRANAMILIASVGGAEEASVLLETAFPSPATGLRVLEELAGNPRLRKTPPGGGEGFVKRLIQEGDAALRPAALALAGLWRIAALKPTIDAMARAEGAPEATRRAAFEALADYGDSDALKSLSTAPAAVIALSRIDPKAAAEKAASITTPETVDALVTAFLSRQGGAEALAAAYGTAAPGADAAKLGLRAMSSAGRQDEALRAILSKAAGISSAAVEYSAELMKSLAAEALADGDPVAGEKVFRGTLTNCFSCHAIGSAGGKVGPDLSAVGTGLPIDMVIESILWPNRQVKEGYSSLAVITTGDQIYQGFHASEDKQTLILRDPGKDELIRIPIPEIRARKTIGSVMPEGLTNGLTRTELRDLIRFTADLGKPGAFRVPDKAYVRRWWVGTAKDLPGAAWLPRFSRVAGDLPLEEIGNARWLRFNVEVLKPGRFQLQFNNATGLRVEVDGSPMGSPELDLPKGTHVFTLSLDPSEREGAGLRAQIEPAPRSDGELRILN